MKIITIPKYNLLIISVLFSSCASLFNENTHRIRVSTNLPVEAMAVNGNLVVLKNQEAALKIKREKAPLKIEWVTKDSIQSVLINSRNSFNYLADGIFTYGLGFLVERNNPKRYYHQKNIYIEQKGDQIKIRRFAPVTKGTRSISFTMPYINHFYLQTVYGYRHVFGFLGAALTGEYYYKQNKSIVLETGIAIDNAAPFPIAPEYIGKYRVDYTTLWYTSFMQRHTFRSFDFAYGLSFSKYNWIENDNSGNVFIQRGFNYPVFGFSFSSSYRITPDFYAGILYQPGILRPGQDFKTTYQHLLSVLLRSKIAEWKR
jgi:hypothetical protein